MGPKIVDCGLTGRRYPGDAPDDREPAGRRFNKLLSIVFQFFNYQRSEGMKSKRMFITQRIVVIALIIIAIYILFQDMYMSEGAMTREEINSAMQELTQITDSNDSEPERISKLTKLAKRVGAGTINTRIAESTEYKGVLHRPQTPIQEAELVQNINQALQTHMMVDSCKTANKQYKIAVLAAIVAVFSTLIAWNVSVKRTTMESHPIMAEASVQNASENKPSSIINSSEISSGEDAGTSMVSSTGVEENEKE